MTADGLRLFDELMRFKPDELTPNAWAVKAGVSRTIWADLRRHGNPSRRTLSKLLEAAGSSLAEFEALRVAGPSIAPAASGLVADPGRGWNPASLTPLPLLSTASGGRWDRVDPPAELIKVDRERIVAKLPRPYSLANERAAYAVTVVIETMWPRFRQGRRLAVSPAAAAEVGDDVLVLLAGGGGALIGELRSRGPSGLRIRQFNPPQEFDISATEVEAVHKVLGELL